MPLIYKLYILNERTGAATRVQDASAHRIDEATTPPESAGATIGQGTLGLDQLDLSPDLVVDSLCECWEGWVDATTGEWSPDYDSPYALREYGKIAP